MKRKSFFYAVVIAASSSFLIFSLPSFAQEDTDALKQQIAELQQRIEVLEAEKQAPPSRDSWDPFEEMERMHEEMNHMFRNTFFQDPAMNQGVFSSQMSFDPNFDVKEDEKGYLITFDMSGFDKDKIDIQVNPRSITVQGQQNTQKTEENKNQYFNAQMYGSFIRTIPLPEDADTAKVKTEKQGDKLIIRLPKKTTT